MENNTKTYLENEEAVEQVAVVEREFKKDHMRNRKQKRLIFYSLMIALPLIQFAICYIYVNINSIIMSLYQWDPGEYAHVFVGFDNFKLAWKVLISSGQMILNSLQLYAVNLFIVLFLAMVFSYYIAKKYPLSKFFRTVLYLPHVVSSVVLAMLYKYICEDVYVYLAELPAGSTGLLRSQDTQYAAVLFYNIWLGFGTNVMLFTGAMSGIDGSVIESAQLDGVNVVQEFIYITIPMIFPTFITFIVTGMAGIFTNQMHLFTFFGSSNVYPENMTLGYYMYFNTAKFNQQGGFMYYDAVSGLGGFPGLSAMGLMITVVLAPATLTVRKLLEKYGPRTD